MSRVKKNFVRGAAKAPKPPSAVAVPAVKNIAPKTQGIVGKPPRLAETLKGM